MLPLPVRILHSDNGSEFINHALQQHNTTLTRSRSNRKNDNCLRHKCRVEQKNYASARKIVGYGRFSDEKGFAALQVAYSSYDNLLNYFYPCQKLISKVKKTYNKPQSPYDRAILDGELPKKLKDALIARKASIDLMAEMAAIQKAVDKLRTLADPVPEFITKRAMKPLLFDSYALILT